MKTTKIKTRLEREREKFEFEMAQATQRIAQLVGGCVPDRVGFTIVLFEQGGSFVTYASSVDREASIDALDRIVTQLRAGLPSGK